MNDQENKKIVEATDGLGVPEFLKRKPEVKAEENVGQEAPAEAPQQN